MYTMVGCKTKCHHSVWYKVTLLVCIFPSLCHLASVYRSERSPYAGEKVLRLHLNSEADAKLVDSLESQISLDVWGEDIHSKKKYVDVRVSRNNTGRLIDLLSEKNINYEVIIEDLQELVDLEKAENDELEQEAHGRRKRSLSSWSLSQTGFSNFFKRTIWEQEESQSGEPPADGYMFYWQNIVGRYVSHREIDEWLEYATSAEPKLDIKLINIGKSVEQRPMNVLKIATKNSDVNKPVIYMDGGIHAREWVSPATMVFIIYELISSYGIDAQTSVLLDNYDWYFLTVVNPDGYEYSRKSERFWRKNRASLEGTSCIGVDLNRNFGFHWAECGGGGSTCSLRDKCSITYAGPSPFSEPESSAVEKFFKSMKNRIQVYISLHSYSQLWLTPWGHTTQPPSDNEDLMELANVGIKAIENRYGTKYVAGAPSVLLYLSSGDSMSWAKSAGVKYSYTLELRDKGHYGFVLPPHLIMPTAREAWDGIKAAVIKLIQKGKPQAPAYKDDVTDKKPTDNQTGGSGSGNIIL